MSRRTALLFPLLLAGCANLGPIAQNIILPEVREFQPRDSAELAPAPLPRVPPPRTVSDPQPKAEQWNLSLDEAIKIALVNGQVVRVLAGLSAQASGRTIYDVGVAAASIDQQQARFDPRFQWDQAFNRTETPSAVFDPFDPNGVSLLATRIDQYRSEARLAKTNVLGGEWLARWAEDNSNFTADPKALRVVGGANAAAAGQNALSQFPLDPQNRSLWEIGYTQPLLQGGGYAVNMAPIVIARLDTERSYFQYKDSVQELVRGVVEAYWQLVQARTDQWARQIQVEQSKAALDREEARLRKRIGDLSLVAQARLTYHQFRSSLVAANALVLAREGALRNLLGLPASDGKAIVPVSLPTSQEYRPDWQSLLGLAEARRPDIVELKLIIEADQQRLIQAENFNLPQLNANALYRWNGLSGEAPNGRRVASGAGQFTDWTVALNFSVPLGLREGRARVRQQSLIIARDRANLDQGLHAASHNLAIVVRDLDSAYQQFLALRETRKAAEDNLRVQNANAFLGRGIYLDFLRALTAWGDAVSAEAAALLSYNTQLANLERNTGTILETHGLVFNEERFGAAGPLGKHFPKLYPGAMDVLGEPKRYPPAKPRDNVFGLPKPEFRRGDSPDKPRMPGGAGGK